MNTHIINEDHKNLLALADSISMKSLLTMFKINYSVIDVNGYYLVQNNILKNVVESKNYAPEIDSASWADCEQVMRNGKQATRDEYYNGRYYFSIKQPVIKNNVLIQEYKEVRRAIDAL